MAALSNYKHKIATKQTQIEKTKKTEPITLALGIASVSSRNRSLIACICSSNVFTAASTADKSTTLLAGYTARQRRAHKIKIE